MTRAPSPAPAMVAVAVVALLATRDGTGHDLHRRGSAGRSPVAVPGRVHGPAPAATCPAEMALVEDRVCVDRWEASLVEVQPDGSWLDWPPYFAVEGRRVRAVSRAGVIPQGYISGGQAASACRQAGKRLCRVDEWLSACRGPQERVYPYGENYVPGRCNVARTLHPVVQLFGAVRGIFDGVHLNDPVINMQPDTLALTGEYADCVSPWGVFDLVGNVHEWIDDREGTFKGGYYVDAEINGHGCLYTTTAHVFSYHDYSTGFRCCMDPP